MWSSLVRGDSASPPPTVHAQDSLIHLRESAQLEGKSKVSDSSVRAQAAEAENAALRAQLAAKSKVSDSSVRAQAAEAENAALRARLAAKSIVSESAIRAQAAEAENAALRARLAAKTEVSDSSVRAQAAEAENAALRAALATKSRASESSVRAQAAEAENAKLRAQLAAKTKVSDSSVRAQAAEAENAKLRARLAAKSAVPAVTVDAGNFHTDAAAAKPTSGKKKKDSKRRPKKNVCWAFVKAGSCSKGTTCKYVHERKPHEERERDDMEDFAGIVQEMKDNIKKVEDEMKREYVSANWLDLVIVMDCTGSMGPWIDEAKASILSTIANVKRDHVNATVRVGFVAYRDFCDGDKRLEVHPLSTNVESVRQFIGQLGAFGGGDGPEDIPGGLDAALKMGFQGGARRIVLVADAACHGAQYHDSWDDSEYAAEIKASPDIRQQMQSLARNRIDVTFIEVVPKHTAKMVAILQREYKSAMPSDASASSFLKVSLASAGDVAAFAPTLRKSAGSSLESSKSRSAIASSKKVVGVSTHHHYGPTGHLSFGLSTGQEGSEESRSAVSTSARIVPAPETKPLDWDDIDWVPELAAVRHSYHFRPGEVIDWSNVDLKHTTQQTSIRLLPTCFAKGAMRSAHAMFDSKMGKRFVAKSYFGKAASRTRVSSSLQLENDVEMQIVAKQLATEFSLKPAVEDAVDFIFTCWYEIKDTVAAATAGISSDMLNFTAEPYIEGSTRSTTTTMAGSTMPTSSSATRHRRLATLRGRRRAIHAEQEDKFGPGNLSQSGMTAFFATHECNDVCAALRLKPCKEKSGGSSARAVAACDGLTLEEKVARLAVDKSMTCSCPLCGTIVVVPRSEFIKVHGKGREVYCGDCTTRVYKREPYNCAICKEEAMFSPYWYDMKGMEHPSTCKKCKAAAAGGRSL